MVSSTARSAPPAIATAGARRPLSGPTSTPAAGHLDRDRPTVRPDAGVDDGQHDAARDVLDGTGKRQRPRPDVVAGTSWVRSMTVTWRARSRITPLTTPTNSSAEP